MKIFMLVDDYTVDALAEIAMEFEILGLQVVALSDFLQDYGVIYNKSLAKFDATQPLLSTASSLCLIINRAVEISDRTLRRIDGGTMTLTRNLVHHALNGVFKQISHVVGTPGMFSAVGHALPLHLQYKLVSANANLPGLRVPAFRLARREALVDTSGMIDPIMKSTWDLFSWSSTTAGSKVLPNKLVVTKPVGRAVVFYFIGDIHDGFFVRGGEDVGEGDIGAAAGWIREVKRLFNAQCGEVLAMLTADGIVFMAFSHGLTTSSEHVKFRKSAKDGLRALIAQTINCKVVGG